METRTPIDDGPHCNYDGPQINVSDKMYVGSVYNISVYVRMSRWTAQPCDQHEPADDVPGEHELSEIRVIRDQSFRTMAVAPDSVTGTHGESLRYREWRICICRRCLRQGTI